MLNIPIYYYKSLLLQIIVLFYSNDIVQYVKTILSIKINYKFNVNKGKALKSAVNVIIKYVTIKTIFFSYSNSTRWAPSMEIEKIHILHINK